MWISKLTRFHVAAESPTIGASLSIDMDLTNNGTKDSPGGTLIFYQSSDEIIESLDLRHRNDSFWLHC